MAASEDKPAVTTGDKEQFPTGADALANTKDQEVTPQEGTENDEHLPFELGQKLGYHRSAPLTLYQIVDYVFVVIAAVLTVRLA